MSHLVTDISKIKEHHRVNHVELVRVIGSVLDYDPMNARIIIRSVNSLAPSADTIQLTMDDDLYLSDPQLCYTGTVVDAYGLYDGTTVRIISIGVVDIHLENQDRRDLQYISNLKKNPL